MIQAHNLAQLPPDLNYNDFVEDLTAAHRALAQLDALLNQTPNPKIFERTFITKEAVLSSRIEGTIATLSEVLGYDAGEELSTAELREDAREIVNYRQALTEGVAALATQPIGENLIKQLHKVLLHSGRGANRAPGEFRRHVVYIGKAGAGIENATYIPPEPQQVVPLFQNLLHYIHDMPERDELVRIAAAHYQFEAIHPFSDGNGRTGRLLITLLLHDRKLLKYPYLYLSEYFEAHRQEYYERLRGVSYHNEWSAWIRFFLNGIAEEAAAGSRVIQSVADLHRDLQPRFVKLSSEYGLLLLEALFQRPIFTVPIIREHMGLTNVQTGYTLVEKLLEAGVITDATPERQRGKRYEFSALLKLVRSRA